MSSTPYTLFNSTTEVFASFILTNDELVTANSTKPLPITTTTERNGFASFGSGSPNIPIPSDGDYDFTFSLQVDPGSGGHEYFFWLETSADAITWTPISNTNSCVHMTGTQFSVFTVQFTVQLGPGTSANYLRVATQGDQNYTIKTLTALTTPAVPSGSPDCPGFVGYIRKIPK